VPAGRSRGRSQGLWGSSGLEHEGDVRLERVAGSNPGLDLVEFPFTA